MIKRDIARAIISAGFRGGGFGVWSSSKSADIRPDLVFGAFGYGRNIWQWARAGDGIISGQGPQRARLGIDPNARHALFPAQGEIFRRAAHHDHHIGRPARISAFNSTEEKNFLAGEIRRHAIWSFDKSATSALACAFCAMPPLTHIAANSKNAKKEKVGFMAPPPDAGWKQFGRLKHQIEQQLAGHAQHNKASNARNSSRRRWPAMAPNCAPITPPIINKTASTISTVWFSTACRTVTALVTKII